MGLRIEIDIYLDEELDDAEADAYEQAARFLIAACFDESQENCPIRSGDLLQSGYLVETASEAYFGYSAPYAKEAEEGRGHPGEKYYFEGSHFIEEAVMNNVAQFDKFLVLALQSEFTVYENTAGQIYLPPFN